MGEMAGKVTQEYNVSMDSHGPSAHPMGEMAGKVTREYNVSMDIHGLSAHPMREDGWKITLYPWIHGLSTHLMGLIPCIARSWKNSNSYELAPFLGLAGSKVGAMALWNSN